MRLFPQDNDVELYSTGFADDVLERNSISKQLSELVERIEDPLVIALDDKWGSGKTFFLKRWVGAHKLENGGAATTVYFDAFENDYLNDPLVSIITAVGARLEGRQPTKFESFKNHAAKLAKPAFGIGLSILTFGAKEQLNALGDAVVDAASGEIRDAAQGLWDVERDRRNSMHAFRNSLSELTLDPKAPIVIVVDELDRCRPDYALSVLEVIKHFFSVPNVHFILGVNGKALRNSVKARYGSEIDAESYLRKFISLSFSLPNVIGPGGRTSTIEKYSKKLISDMDLSNPVSNGCADLLKYVSSSRDVSLRDVGKVFSKVALLPDKVREGKLEDGIVRVLCALLVTSVVDPHFHEKLVSGNVQVSEARDYLGASREKTVQEIDGKNNSDYDRKLTIWLADVIRFCGVEELKDIQDLPSWAKDNPIDLSSFKWNYGWEDRKSIVAGIQKDWVDIFKA